MRNIKFYTRDTGHELALLALFHEKTGLKTIFYFPSA